jgi:hypothetical protein
MPNSADLGSFGCRALLSGAGLSKNWGGYLGGEIWGCLLSHPKIANDPDLRTILLRRTNFELALADLKSERRNASPFYAALAAVFDAHDLLLRSEDSGRPQTFKFLKFLKRFKAAGTGYLFTLNQDLLLEGLHHDDIYHERPSRPGIPYAQGAYTARFRGPTLLDGEAQPPAVPTVVPDGGFPLAGRLNYIKLHGSVDWPGDGGMVVGGGKPELIAAHPLLSWYRDVFRQVCSHNDVRLMVIGYSFNDPHINETIANGVRGNGLRFYVINPEDPTSLKERLQPADLWNGVTGYSTRSLRELFAGHDMQDTAELARIARDFFE